MGSLKIRAATPAERAEAARQWASSFSPHARMVAPGSARQVTIGSLQRSISPHLWRRAHAALVTELLAPGGARLDVLVLDEKPAEPLGWVCTEGELLHYVYVVPDARRRPSHLGTRLLEHAAHLGATVATHATAGGRALVDARMTRGGEAASRRAHNPESPVRSRASLPTEAT